MIENEETEKRRRERERKDDDARITDIHDHAGGETKAAELNSFAKVFNRN